MESTELRAAAAGLPLLYDDAYEVPEQNEDETARRVAQTLAEIGDITFADSGLGLRTVHAKGQGILRGELRVFDLPLPYAQGMFATPQTLQAIVRLSTSPGDVLDDNVSTPRGFALKVVGVNGERLSGNEGSITQAVLLVNGPAFLNSSAKDFLGGLKLLASTTDRVPKLKRAFSAVLRGTEKLVEALGGESATLKGLGGHPETNILGETYFSQVPFLYGQHMGKWAIVPVSPQLLALKEQPVDLSGKPDGLRAAVVDHFAQHGAQWDLCVQLCTDIESMPIEDASVRWPEDKSAFIPVARLSVEPQNAWPVGGPTSFDETLSFSPWNGLAAHRPLGSVNRVRQVAYPSSADARSARSRCPIREPRRVDM